nr:hypothetical protein [Pseudomonas aeruginosa]
MSNQPFVSFGAAIKAIQNANSKEEIESLVDQIDSEYAENALEVTAKDWGTLAGVVLVRGSELGLLGKPAC